MLSEHAVMVIIEGFKKTYLKGETLREDEQLLGFVVVDEDQEVIVASTYDPSYGLTLRSPIKNWVVYRSGLGVRAFVMKDGSDFKNFALGMCKAAAA